MKLPTGGVHFKELDVRYFYPDEEYGELAYDQPPFAVVIPGGMMCWNTPMDGEGRRLRFDLPIRGGWESENDPNFVDEPNNWWSDVVRHHEGTLVVMQETCVSNLAHWLHDVFPCVHLANLLGLGELGGHKVRLHIDHEDCPWRLEHMAMMGYDREMLVNSQTRKCVSADRLVFVHAGGSRAMWVKRFLGGLLRPFGELVSGRSSRRRIYLSRTDTGWHKNLNEEDVWGLLERYGFERFSMSGRTQLQAAAIFSDAAYVVGPQGSGWMNTYYSPPGVKALQFWHPDRYEEEGDWWPYTYPDGVDIEVMTGHPCGAPENKNFVIDPGEVEKAIRRWGLEE